MVLEALLSQSKSIELLRFSKIASRIAVCKTELVERKYCRSC